MRKIKLPEEIPSLDTAWKTYLRLSGYDELPQLKHAFFAGAGWHAQRVAAESKKVTACVDRHFSDEQIND